MNIKAVVCKREHRYSDTWAKNYNKCTNAGLEVQKQFSCMISKSRSSHSAVLSFVCLVQLSSARPQAQGPCCLRSSQQWQELVENQHLQLNKHWQVILMVAFHSKPLCNTFRLKYPFQKHLVHYLKWKCGMPLVIPFWMWGPVSTCS